MNKKILIMKKTEKDCYNKQNNFMKLTKKNWKNEHEINIENYLTKKKI